jgi:sulfane dehydrogenase subunit SoxC
LIAFAHEWRAHFGPSRAIPLRLVVPGWEGNMWVKWIRRIEVGDQPWHHREETSKYTDLAGRRQAQDALPGRWTSSRSSPIPARRRRSAHGKGQTVLTGVAWSGRGTITRVDVSIDGGKNWRAARIDGPSLDKSIHRFYYDFDWDGSPLLLQSRAMDSTGYVQPTKSELRAERGSNSIYHNNGIQTWHVKANGEVENVEVS